MLVAGVFLAGGKGGSREFKPIRKAGTRPCKRGCFLLLGVFPLQDLKWVANHYKLQEEKCMKAQGERAHPREGFQVGPRREKGRESGKRRSLTPEQHGLSSLRNWDGFVLLSPSLYLWPWPWRLPLAPDGDLNFPSPQAACRSPCSVLSWHLPQLLHLCVGSSLREMSNPLSHRINSVVPR